MVDRQNTMVERSVFTPGVRGVGEGHVRLPVRLTPETQAALALLALASVNLIGFLGVLLFIAGSGVLVLSDPRYNSAELLKFSPLLLIPILAVASTIWSDVPQRSMRYGLELLLTAVAAIIVCRNLRPERFVLVLFGSFFVISLTVLARIPQSVASNLPLDAYWGSKNQVGFAGFMLLALSIGVLCDRRQPWPARLLAVGASGYAFLVGFLSQSGGTTTSIALTLVGFPPLAALAYMHVRLRIGVAILAVILLIVTSFFISDIDAAVTSFRVNVLNKDATLTGRTYLWDFADRLSATHPWLGTGYFAFWRQGNIDAEGLWRWGGIASRAGFNFHNAFIGIRVDLGLIGMWLLIATCTVIALATLASLILAPSVATACLATILAVNYARSYVEEGLVAPFSLVTVTWLATILYAIPGRRWGPGAAGSPAGADRAAPNGFASRREKWGIDSGRAPLRGGRASVPGTLGMRGEPGL